jgi:tetratricopeptide (TPR) repeat protein
MKGTRQNAMARLRLLLFAVAAGLAASSEAGADVPQEARRGAKLFADSSYEEAAEAFRQATIAAPDDARWRYDLGLSEALGAKYEDALNNLGAPARTAPSELAAASLYNAGNVHMAMGKFAEAAAAYRQALVRNPGDVEAKHNFELALRQLQQSQSSPDSSGSRKDSTQNNKQQDKNQKQDQQQQDQQKQDQGQPESQGNQNKDSTGQTPPPNPDEQPASDSTLSREQAERILRALADDEARLRNQARKVMILPAPGGKDW